MRTNTTHTHTHIPHLLSNSFQSDNWQQQGSNSKRVNYERTRRERVHPTHSCMYVCKIQSIFRLALAFQEESQRDHNITASYIIKTMQ